MRFVGSSDSTSVRTSACPSAMSGTGSVTNSRSASVTRPRGRCRSRKARLSLMRRPYARAATASCGVRTWWLVRLRLGAAAGDGDLPRLRHLDQAERAHELLERGDLLGLPHHLDDDRAAGHVDDPGLEDRGELHDLLARGRIRGDLEHGQLARDRLLRLEVADLD